MCCLFGLADYGHSLSGKQKARLLSILGKECEMRGTDATGYAYNSGGRLNIYKRPLPAHKMHLFVPGDAAVVMGHTRMTTQGSEKHNHNNHPFPGETDGGKFALAHNGILYNDSALRKRLHLPQAKIETDSYIAVQLLEAENKLDFSSLRYMAETISGSFTISVLDEEDDLYIVKGDNPLCLIHLPKLKLYLYASTEDILAKAFRRMNLPEAPRKVSLDAGDILRIDRNGRMETAAFDASSLWAWGYGIGCYGRDAYGGVAMRPNDDKQYLSELKSVAACYGYSDKAIDRLLASGFSTDEIEEFIYCGYGEV